MKKYTPPSDIVAPDSSAKIVGRVSVPAATKTSRLVNVCVSRELADFLASPQLRPLVRLVIIDIARSSYAGERKTVNQRLLTASIGRRAYDQFVRVAQELESRGLMQVDWRYSPRFQSRSFRIPSHVQSSSAQHMETDRGFEGCVWMVEDLGVLDDSLKKGREKLGWLSVEATRASLTEVTLEGALKSRNRLKKLAEKEIIKKKPRIKTDELAKKVDRQVAAIRSAVRNPSGGTIRRKSGRIYHRLSNLPKWARQLYVRICGETPVNVDIRACYIWTVAASLRQRRLKAGMSTARIDTLLDLIEAGQFYERLATYAGMSSRGAKASFATLCLFGGPDEHFGANRLWYALQSICPDITAEIIRLRHRYGGPSGFARHCQRLEGAVMLDGLLVKLHDMGIPCVTLHDGALLRPQHRELAVEIIKARTLELFGRACAVSG